MIKSRLDNFRSDILQIIFVLLDALLIPAELYLHLENNSLHVTVALTAACIFPFIVLLFGRIGMWIFFFLYGNITAWTITYDDFTSLFILIACVIFLPKLDKKKMIIIAVLYIIDIFVVATLHDKDPIYLYIHFVVCVAFTFAVFWKNKQSRTLDLLPDEIKILDQLLEGKCQKNVDGFSENTVGKKLKAARDRNNITDTEQLLILYGKQKRLND